MTIYEELRAGIAAYEKATGERPTTVRMTKEAYRLLMLELRDGSTVSTSTDTTPRILGLKVELV